MTQSVPPSMIEFPCGKPTSRGSNPIAHVNLPAVMSASALFSHPPQVNQPLLGAAREQLPHLHAERAVDLERGREAVEPVALVGEGLIVIGVDVKDL